jgi:hypothetical protein
MADSHVIRCGPESTRNPMFMEIVAKDATELATYASKCIPGSIGTAGSWVLTNAAPTSAT